jgi:hypothetical protein
VNKPAWIDYMDPAMLHLETVIQASGGSGKMHGHTARMAATAVATEWPGILDVIRAAQAGSGIITASGATATAESDVG